jgi:hypothetical protein
MNQSKDVLKVMAELYAPGLTGAIDKAGQQIDALTNKLIGGALKSAGESGIAPKAAKLLAVAKVMGGDPDELKLRLVDENLTFTEADLYYQWSGMLAEFRLGGPFDEADPLKHFSVYIPGFKSSNKGQPRGSLHLKVLHRKFQ